MYRLFSSLLHPLGLAFLVLLIATVWLARRGAKRNLGPFLFIAAGLVLLFCCSDFVAHFGVGILEWHYPPLDRFPDHVDAVVVLGGGVDKIDTSGKHLQLEETARARCAYAAELYHRVGPCPLLASGGIAREAQNLPAPAQAMGDFLKQLGVKADDLLIEDESRTTYENALHSRLLLEERRLKHIILVTDATHMSRAAKCFTAQGFDVIPGPCNYRSVRFQGAPEDFFPSADGARAMEGAIHEWLGLFWYWLKGRI